VTSAPGLQTQSPDEGTVSLSARQQAILRLIVHEYIQSGRPVGSKTLTERYTLGLSSATVRNEMAELEASGFVQHLHTSGGRVPTAGGYRFFVDHLMENVELPPGEQIMIRHQFRQAEERLDGWMELAATVLAEIAGNVSVVTAPRTVVARLRHLELIALQPRLAMLILVTLESTVKQVMIHLVEPADQERLSGLADQLANSLRGTTAEEMSRHDVGSDAVARQVIEQAVATLSTLDTAGGAELRHSGLANIVGQPELAEGDLQRILALLTGGGLVSALLPQLGQGQDVQVFIGDENLPAELRHFGVVVSTYGVDDVVTGLLGVLGPTRMSYWRTISSVRYVSRLMSDLMLELYPRLD
jgi:heat-inducible transcriptional repressor